MKPLLLLLLVLALGQDSQLDYSLLPGSWSQKSFANTPDTGIFTFSTDSIATLEMRKGDSNELIASVNGPYSINRKKKTLTMKILGKEKTFSILKLQQNSLTIKNETENKPAQTFERHSEK